MTDPTQASAARLTAIAEKCERNNDSLLVFGNDYSDVLLDAANALCEAATLLAQIDTLRQEIDRLRGAMAADDERLRAAERRVFGPDVTFGCDAADHMADKVDTLRQEQARLEAALVEWKHRAEYAEGRIAK